MKRCVSFTLAILILMSLCGCQSAENKDDKIIFYYQQADYTDYPNQDVVVGEERTLSGDRDDLSYLLTLYMLGPLDDKLLSPFPSKTYVESIHRDGDTVSIYLSSMDSALSDSGFTVASVCLAETIFGLTHCKSMTISSGQRSITLDRSNTLFHDDVSPTENPMEATP